MAFKIGHGKNDPTQAKSSFRWPSCRLSERKLIVAKSIIHTLHFCEIPNVCNFTQQYPNCVMLWNGSGQNRLYIIYIYIIYSPKLDSRPGIFIREPNEPLLVQPHVWKPPFLRQTFFLAANQQNLSCSPYLLFETVSKIWCGPVVLQCFTYVSRWVRHGHRPVAAKAQHVAAQA